MINRLVEGEIIAFVSFVGDCWVHRKLAKKNGKIVRQCKTTHTHAGLLSLSLSVSAAYIVYASLLHPIWAYKACIGNCALIII